MKHVKALYGDTFGIKQGYHVPKDGSVTIAFDHNYLGLDSETAGADINWGLKPLQAGSVRVCVTVYGGKATSYCHMVYDVTILRLGSSTKALPVVPEETFSWLGYIDASHRLVKRCYSDAQLYEVACTHESRSAVTVPREFSQFTFVFNVSSHGKPGNAVVKSLLSGELDNTVLFIPSLWLKGAIIPWPPEEPFLSPTEALENARKAGYDGIVFDLVLRPVLYHSDQEPYYIFNTAKHGFVFVGAKAGKVMTDLTRI